mmetsp:Transcript_51076/g.59673  ORF Transcript_51076/g.59673 Transcript_51076/m.59673 type:complete len:85 (-) Transcript_51076:221-475(-)
MEIHHVDEKPTPELLLRVDVLEFHNTDGDPIRAGSTSDRIRISHGKVWNICHVFLPFSYFLRLSDILDGSRTCREPVCETSTFV